MSYSKDEQILYQVAFKGAIELVANGIAELETDDVGAEVIALTDALYEPLAAKTGIGGTGKAKSSSRSKGSSKPSRRRGSSGRSSSGGGDFKYASDKQAAFIEKLLDEKAHDVEFDDDGFVWDGDDVDYTKVPSGITQEVIEYLLAFDDA